MRVPASTGLCRRLACSPVPRLSLVLSTRGQRDPLCSRRWRRRARVGSRGRRGLAATLAKKVSDLATDFHAETGEGGARAMPRDSRKGGRMRRQSDRRRCRRNARTLSQTGIGRRTRRNPTSRRKRSGPTARRDRRAVAVRVWLSSDGPDRGRLCEAEGVARDEADVPLDRAHLHGAAVVGVPDRGVAHAALREAGRRPRAPPSLLQ